jgi:WD40 repeat protein
MPRPQSLGLAVLVAVALFPAPAPAQKDGKVEAPTIEPTLRLGSNLFRQGEPVSAVCFSPDGKLLASASASNTLYLWDAATGKLLRRSLPGFSRAAPPELGFSPDGKKLIGVGLTELTTWDQTLKGPTAQLKDPSVLYALAVVSDGTVLTGGFNKVVTHWDLKAGAAVRRFAGHQGVVHALAVSRKGDTFFSAGEDRTVRHWEIATGKGAVLLDNLPQPVRCLALSADGATLYTAGPLQPVQVWDVLTGKLLCQHDNAKEEVKRLALSPDGNTLVALDLSGNLFVWAKPGGKAAAWKVPPLGSPGGIAFSPDGKRLALGGKDLFVLDVEKGTPVPDTAGHWGPVTQAAFAPNGQTLATTGWDRTLRLWGIPKGEQLQVVPWAKGFSPIFLRYTPDGKHLLAVSGQGAAVLCGAGQGKVVKELVKHPGGLRGAALSADGRWLAGGTLDREVIVWDAATGKEKRRWTGWNGVPLDLRFLPDHRTLVVSDFAGEVVFLDLETGREQARLGPFAHIIKEMAPHPGGRHLAAVEADRPRLPNEMVVLTGYKVPTLYWFDLAHLEEPRPGRFALARPWSLCFAPDGRHLYGAVKHLVHVLDQETGNPRGVLAGSPGGDVQVLACAADNRFLAAGGSDSVVLVWDVARFGKGAYQGKVETAFDTDPWDVLAGADVRQAYRAMVRLAEEPAKSIPLLRDRLLVAFKGKATLLQHLRGVETLEMMGSPEARQALELVASKAPSPEVRPEAAGAVKRLQDRPGVGQPR